LTPLSLRLPRSPVAIALTAALCLSAPALASESEAFPPERIVVVGERGETDWLSTPASVSVVDQEAIRRAQPQLTLGESIGKLPGVFIQNRANFAQDARISIRGFGARTPFGIRGLQLIVDGIPQTLPDGQGQVDSLDLSTASRIEVLRGPGASLYGSAAGGVIEVTSFEPIVDTRASGRVAFGFDGYRNYQAQAQGQSGKARYAVGLAHTNFEGHRDHSDFRTTLMNSRFRFDLEDSTQLSLIVSYADAPEADDPGALTQAEVDDDPNQASQRNQDMRSGEKLSNALIGTSLRHGWNDEHETRASGFFAVREFDGRTPSASRGRIELDRIFAGGNAIHNWRREFFGRENQLQVGFELKGQSDTREQRAIDVATGDVGAISVDEVQDVLSFGFFVHDRIELTETISLSASARYDRVEFDLEDDLTNDAGGDDSDDLHFDEWSFAGAAVWTPDPRVNPFVRISTSFETPTATALANPDTDAGGFNPDLKAQTSVQYELGNRGRFSERFEYEAAFFYIRVDDELLPYTQDFSTFYENADSSDRIGLELSVTAQIAEGLRARANYTWSHFEFDRFTDENGDDFDGNRIPGVPRHLANFGLGYRHPIGVFGDFDLQYVGSREADNANRVDADDYVVMNLRGGMRSELGPWSLETFVGIRNLGDEDYIDNLRINQGATGRFFEPAAGRTFYLGFDVAHTF